MNVRTWRFSAYHLSHSLLSSLASMPLISSVSSVSKTTTSTSLAFASPDKVRISSKCSLFTRKARIFYSQQLTSASACRKYLEWPPLREGLLNITAWNLEEHIFMKQYAVVEEVQSLANVMDADPPPLPNSPRPLPWAWVLLPRQCLNTLRNGYHFICQIKGVVYFVSLNFCCSCLVVALCELWCLISFCSPPVI